MNIKRIVLALFLVLITGSMASAELYQSYKYHIQDMEISQAEFQALPEYAQAKIAGPNHPNFEYWKQKIGPDFIHIHHFASGLIKLSRAKMNPEKAKYLYQGAISSFDYMLSHTANNFFLRYMFHFYKGEAFYDMRNYNAALVEYKNTLHFNPGYSMAYVRLYGIYMHYGMKDKAEEIQKEMAENCNIVKENENKQ